MRQFTMNIDEGLLLAAKQHALATGRNVSEIVRELIAREVGWAANKDPSPLDDESVGSILTRYSKGAISRRVAMDELNLDPARYSQFVELMQQHSVGWPTIDQDQIAEESTFVADAIRGAVDAN